MKLSALLIVLIITPLALFSQKEESHHCYKRDHFKNSSLKSNSLSVAQIAETERYDVHYYKLDVAMDNLSTDIAGTGEIHGTARETLDSVLFELFSSYNITEIRLNGVPTPYSRVGSAIKVPVNISTGQSFIIATDYDGTPPTSATNPLGGAGMSNDSSPTWGNQVTWSLSEPFSAYEWWPCKQSLTDKADSCSVHITVPNNCMAGAQGVLENIVDLGNGTSRYEWEHSHVIDYYLISVAVAQYIEYNVTANPIGSGPVTIQNFIYDNPLTLSTFQNDIDETVDFMELFAQLFGPYRFADEKYGHCMAPLSGGMEHQTMTTQGWFAKGLTSHELAHQWWGNNVTCASWADIWMNEGFASYGEHLMLENLYPTEAGPAMINVHDNVMSQPGGSVWVQDSLNENRIFSGRLSYDKGSAIIHTFRFIMNNDSVFFQALKDFQNVFADSTAHGIDFRDFIANASGVDYTAPFNEWYFGEGYPTYSARWNTVGNDLLIEISHTTSSTTPTFTNPLEIKFFRSGNPDTTIRFDITSNLDQFLVPNLDDVINVNEIDPNNWIINDVGSIVKDVSFTADLVESTIVDYIISPNPSNGLFTINSPGTDKIKLEVLDLRGKLIMNSTFSNSTVLDLSDGKSGYYIVHLTDQQGNKVVKTIAKK